MASGDYWTRRSISRRAALRGAAATGGGIAALSLIGCGGGDDDKAATKSEPALDSTKGRPGGTFTAQVDIFPTGLTIINRNDAAIGKMNGLALSSLLANAFGKGSVDGMDSRTLEPDLATAMPEQPDNLTYVFKLRPGVKFHNGRAVTTEDVVYSFNRYANEPTSTFRTNWAGWYDKAEAVDAQTVRVKSKNPYADALQAMTGFDDAYIFAKEHEESPAAAEKIMGSGPYLFASAQAPVLSTWRKNPDYYLKPYPYFDEIKLAVTGDPVKQVADFTARAVDISFWYGVNERDQVKKARPDAPLLEYPQAAYQVVFRVDKAPFNDKRVRQALALTVDRKKIRAAVSNGEGEDDQTLSWINSAFGFRKPKDLGAAAKWWNYDPTQAKQLMSAAGVDKIIECDWTHGAPGIGGQVSLDAAVLTQAGWKELGLANARNNPVPSAQFLTQVSVGNYEGMITSLGLESVAPGRTIWQRFFVPPEGIRPPTSNSGYVNHPQLSGLVDKQLQLLNFEERKASFRSIEDIVAEEQYRVSFSTATRSWFADPKVKNWRIPMFAYRGSARYMMYWWFES